MRVRIDVTAEDIAQGVPSDPCACPVANAVRHTLRCAADVAYNGWLTIEDGEEVFDCVMPARVADFVHAFDSGDPVEPFSFTLNVPARFVLK